MTSSASKLKLRPPHGLRVICLVSPSAIHIAHLRAAVDARVEPIAAPDDLLQRIVRFTAERQPIGRTVQTGDGQSERYFGGRRNAETANRRR